MSAPTIAPLPAPPARAEAPADFTSKMDAFVAALPDFAAEANAVAGFVEENAARSTYTLISWAYTQAFQAVTATRDANGAIVTASIVWPDGIAGVFTTDVASTAFPGAIDAWHATYASTPAKTITQPTVTRDASGAVIAQPAITIV
ncbi:hypothetical protein [Pseudomonas sp. FP1740]|uniref:hypothetical protein n=1 Tax=Pseudomonas sp. FP1740 TaxID=2954078 RepID=UPI002732F6BA|nr:hypothetical protein [Pseudomonas sp. FP1740]WLG43235.1 hypothetical protein PSH69_20550 [Pseudomonas sp. FP1740]